MIRRSARNDPTVGCVVNFEKPLAKAIEDYKDENTAESFQKALQTSFDCGYRAGYLEARTESLRALNPSSEYAR